MDYIAVIGIILIVVAIGLMIYNVQRKPNGIKCSECGNYRVAIVSKEPLGLIDGGLGSAGGGDGGGHSITHVRARYKYKCPDCMAENVVES